MFFLCSLQGLDCSRLLATPDCTLRYSEVATNITIPLWMGTLWLVGERLSWVPCCIRGKAQHTEQIFENKALIIPQLREPACLECAWLWVSFLLSDVHLEIFEIGSLTGLGIDESVSSLSGILEDSPASPSSTLLGTRVCTSRPAFSTRLLRTRFSSLGLCGKPFTYCAIPQP